MAKKGKQAGDRRDFLRKIDLFSDLSNGEADLVLSFMREQKVSRGTIVFQCMGDRLAGGVRAWSRSTACDSDVTIPRA